MVPASEDAAWCSAGVHRIEAAYVAEDAVYEKLMEWD